MPPDTRDWTVVITEGCGACGFTPQPPEATGDRLRATIPLWRRALASGSARQRPAPAVWSAVEYGYFHQDPAVVAKALAVEAQATAAAFDAVVPGQWHRTGRRSNGSVFAVGTFAVYFLHDIEHHVHDVAGR